jgi:hypothetical protein
MTLACWFAISWAYRSGGMGTATCGRVVFGGDAGGGLFAEAYVAAEAGQVLVAGLGL